MPGKGSKRGTAQGWHDDPVVANDGRMTFPVLCDLDGVVWLAHRPIPGSVEAIARLRTGGHRVLFVTNMGLGCIIPPVALNLFISTQLAGVRYEAAVRATIPFIIIMLIDLAIMAMFPIVPLMLPHLIFDYPLPR